jgi:hypothetical protein
MATYAQWKTSGITNATCRACISGAQSSATWAPLLEDSMGQLAELNVGGCIAIASGNASCGKAYQNWFDCRFEACAACAQADLSTCLDAASQAGGACVNAVNNVSTVCGSAITAADTACQGTSFVFEGAIKAQCIGGIP